MHLRVAGSLVFVISFRNFRAHISLSVIRITRSCYFDSSFCHNKVNNMNEISLCCYLSEIGAKGTRKYIQCRDGRWLRNGNAGYWNGDCVPDMRLGGLHNSRSRIMFRADSRDLIHGVL